MSDSEKEEKSKQNKLDLLLLNLPKLASATRKIWEPEWPQGWFHHLVCCITSQQVRFAEGRKIRKKLYALLEETGEKEITQAWLANLDQEQLRETGMHQSRYVLLQTLAKIPGLTLEACEYVKGIGEWTIQATLLCTKQGSEVILAKDKWVRKLLARLFKRDRITERETIKIFEEYWPTDKGLMSCFLWRLKPEGADAILKGKELQAQHFLSK